MKRNIYCSLFCACLCFVSIDANADITAYTVNIDYGIAHTSGGFTGNGMGDLPITGSFNLYLDHDTNFAALWNIDISLNPLGFDWNNLRGTINGTSLYLVSPSPNPMFPDDNIFQGPFDGNSGSLTGTIHEPFVDMYQYDCSMNISTIPEPSSLAMVGMVSGVGLFIRRRFML